MVKAIKVMLIPNNVQKTKMFQYAGASRFAYNWALAREKENYEKGGKFISDSELRKEFTKLRPVSYTHLYRADRNPGGKYDFQLYSAGSKRQIK